MDLSHALSSPLDYLATYKLSAFSNPEIYYKGTSNRMDAVHGSCSKRVEKEWMKGGERVDEGDNVMKAGLKRLLASPALCTQEPVMEMDEHAWEALN